MSGVTMRHQASLNVAFWLARAIFILAESTVFFFVFLHRDRVQVIRGPALMSGEASVALGSFASPHLAGSLFGRAPHQVLTGQLQLIMRGGAFWLG